MSGHPKEEELMDLAEDGGSAELREHAAGCVSCAGRVAELRELLSELPQADVPEPPPLYWEAFRRNVSRRIAEERPRPAWRGWLVPLAALAATAGVAILAQRPVVTHAPSRTTASVARASAPLPAWSALPPAEEDEAMPVLEGLAVGGSDLGEWYEGRGLGPFLAGLTEDETAAVPRTLQAADEGGTL